MVSLPFLAHPGPIGVDIGSRSVKLLQFNARRTEVLDAARWDFSESEPGGDDWHDRIRDALEQARVGRNFQGRNAVVCLSVRDLTVQNIRVPKSPGMDMAHLVMQEARGRVHLPPERIELRFQQAGDVRQGDTVKQEVVIFACDRQALDRLLKTVQAAGLRPVAVDAEPCALRCYVSQQRREADRQLRQMFVNVGAAKTTVVIAKGSQPLFIKYVSMGGQHLDDAVAKNLGMELHEAVALRRHNGDRRSDQRDPEVTQSIEVATRQQVEQLASEISLCDRYHSVTFRGDPLSQVVLSGGEATPELAEQLSSRLNLKCELGEPLRSWQVPISSHRRGQWDVATGLALREVGK